MKMSTQSWEQHVAAARKQQVSTKTYANQHGLSPSTLYYWQRKLQAKANLRSVAHPVGPSHHSGKFVALHVADGHPVRPQHASECALVLAPGVRLEMNELPDPRWLAALARATRGAF